MDIKSVIIIISVILLAAVCGWTIYYVLSNNPSYYGGQPVLEGSDAVSEISKDINELPDESSLAEDVDSLNKAIEDF